MICAHPCPVVMYLASVVESATHACFLLFYDIRFEPSRWQVSFVIFLSNFLIYLL